MKIGIVGFGVVGQAQYSILQDCDVYLYDTIKEMYPNLYEFINTDIIFICLPSETINGQQNLKEINNTLNMLYRENFQGIVVIKSTILYNNIKHWCNKINLVFNPEFLSDNNSFQDAAKQNLIILGGDIHNTKVIEKFYEKHTIIENPSFEHMNIQDAINIKYIRNIYGAYKVLFWEYVQDVTGNTRKMYDLFSKLPNQGDMSQVGMDGYRGYGGKCFTKDVIAFNTDRNHLLTEFMIDYNRKLQDE